MESVARLATWKPALPSAVSTLLARIFGMIPIVIFITGVMPLWPLITNDSPRNGNLRFVKILVLNYRRIQFAIRVQIESFEIFNRVIFKIRRDTMEKRKKWKIVLFFTFFFLFFFSTFNIAILFIDETFSSEIGHVT